MNRWTIRAAAVAALTLLTLGGVATKADVASRLVAYLRSLKPVHHKVPGPFGPNQKPTVLVMEIVPGAGMAPAAPIASRK